MAVCYCPFCCCGGPQFDDIQSLEASPFVQASLRILSHQFLRSASCYQSLTQWCIILKTCGLCRSDDSPLRTEYLVFYRNGNTSSIFAPLHAPIEAAPLVSEVQVTIEYHEAIYSTLAHGGACTSTFVKIPEISSQLGKRASCGPCSPPQGLPAGLHHCPTPSLTHVGTFPAMGYPAGLLRVPIEGDLDFEKNS